MKQQLGVIVTAALVGLMPFTVGATERTSSKAAHAAKTTPAPVRPAPVADPDTPRGDTVVHGFFQGWANGMQKGAKAIGLDKDPLAGRLPGGNSASRRAAEGPFDTDTTR